MENTICETESLRLLARFDFLDVCLLGETGTGKTRAARLIHDLSPRAKTSLSSRSTAPNLRPRLIESELFGHEKGAFTGAIAAKTGKFEAADGGTLFLDEIGELPAETAGETLKVVEEKRVMRVGSIAPRPVDVRIIYATHRDLSVLREDLRYRIAAHAIRLKPLRERRDEICIWRASLSKISAGNLCRRSRRARRFCDCSKMPSGAATSANCALSLKMRVLRRYRMAMGRTLKGERFDARVNRRLDSLATDEAPRN